MALIAAKCPSCGADVTIDNSLESVTCEFCGTQIIQERQIIIHKTDESEKYLSMTELAQRAFNGENYAEAYDYSTKALVINNKDPEMIFIKSLSAGYLAKNCEKNAEVTSGLKKAISLSDGEKKDEMISRIFDFAMDLSVRQEPDFHSAGECEAYAVSIVNQTKLLDDLYTYAESKDEETVIRYCSKIISTAKSLRQSYEYTKISDEKKKNFNIGISLDGISIRSGTENTPSSRYITPSMQIGEMSEIAKKYGRIIEQFSKIRRQQLKSEASEARKGIKTLPLKTKLLHTASSLPMVIIAVILAIAVPAAGILLLAAEIACHVLYTKTDKDNTAKEAYAEARKKGKALLDEKKKNIHIEL